MIYGANGYTAELTARMAVDRGMKPILAGRNPDKFADLAKELDLPTRGFALTNPTKAAESLRDVPVVLHCAGPFSHTYRGMSDACLLSNTHYLDITGEIVVFEGLAKRHNEAKEKGIMLLPGVGFDVVPSDCLALHLKRQLPSASHLSLGFQGLGRISRGTAKTMVESMGQKGAIRQQGKIVGVPPAYKTRMIDFGRGPVEAITIPWGDVSTAYYSTGIENIEVFSVFPKAMRPMMVASRYIGFLLRSAPVQAFLKSRVNAQPPGPSDEERQRGLSLLWGEVTDDYGNRHEARLRGPEGYTLTALTSLNIVEKVLAGKVSTGFQTPAKLYGPDLILEIDGVTREDIEADATAA
jgi:short subunit dehydrogenase-like uncharacterized protein